MKLSLAFALATGLVASCLVTSAAMARGHVTTMQKSTPRAIDSDVATFVAYTSDVTMILAPMTITGHTGASTTWLAWVCGPVEANLVGGSQRTCEWR